MDVNEIISELRRSIKPYQEEFDTYARLPEVGRSREEIIAEMEDFYAREEHKWRDGYVSGAVYHGGQEHIDFQNQVYAINSQTNPLHFDVWPSGVKFEAEIVAMTANMLDADKTEDEIVGTVTSGGTESILLAMKTYRDRARAEKGITEPEMIVPTTAHAAFDKASQYFDIKMVRVPVGDGFPRRCQGNRGRHHRQHVVIVGSSPPFPHGIIDPIEELSELARAARHRLPHRRLPGRFRPALGGEAGLPGAALRFPPAGGHFDVVRHAQVRLRRQGHLGGAVPRRATCATTSTSRPPNGRAGCTSHRPSRAAAPARSSAACWAAMLSIGEQGYLDATRGILSTGRRHQSRASAASPSCACWATRSS